MQKTSFDRFLMRMFLHQFCVYTMSPAPWVGRKIRVKDMGAVAGKKYRYMYVTRSSTAADRFIAHLKENGQMFTTEMVDRTGMLASFFAPKEKSFTWRSVGWFFWVMIGCGVWIGCRNIWMDPALMRMIMDAMRVLKG
jgi:hypothetical protein